MYNVTHTHREPGKVKIYNCGGSDEQYRRGLKWERKKKKKSNLVDHPEVKCIAAFLFVVCLKPELFTQTGHYLQLLPKYPDRAVADAVK